MRIRTYFFALCFFLMFFLQAPSFAQLIELNQEQDIVISGPGFFPFSSEANEEFKELVEMDSHVAIIINNFDGKKLKVAPAADGREIGRKINVRGDGAFVIDYKKRSANSFGLSFVPKPRPTTITLTVEPFAKGSCPNPIADCDGPDGTDCGENLGKCCEADANGNKKKICGRVAASRCDCVVMSR